MQKCIKLSSLISYAVVSLLNWPIRLPVCSLPFARFSYLVSLSMECRFSLYQ